MRKNCDFINELSPEHKLLLYCTRTCEDSLISKIVDNGIDWIYLDKLAFEYNLKQAIHWKFNLIHQKNVHPTFLQSQKDHFTKTVKGNLLLTYELLKILKILKSHEIIGIPYNGPVLAYNAYENLGLKGLSELNIFIDKNDVLKAKYLLSSLDYHLKIPLKTKNESSYIKSQREFKFINKKNKIRLNVHWIFPDVSFSFKNPTSLFNEANIQNVEINAQKIPTFSIEDSFIFLCLNFIGNPNKSLSSLSDLAGLIINNEDFNWQQIHEKATKFNIKRIVNVNYFLINCLLGVEIPPEIQNEIKSDKRAIEASNEIIKNIFSDFELKNSPIDEFINMRLKIREDIFDGIKDIFRFLFISDLEDKKLFSMPSLLLPFYSFFRPLYLIQKYGIGPFKPDIHTDFAPSPLPVVKKMLKLAEVGSEDVIYDLGCGDGRIIIMAAKEYGARGVGVDIDPEKIAESKVNANKEGVNKLTTFIRQDMAKVDLSDATVVTMFLLSSDIIKLKPKLSKLHPKTRIVSNPFCFGSWTPSKTNMVSHNGILYPLYLWNSADLDIIN